MPKLIITERNTKKEQFFTLSSDEITMGRSSVNTIELPSKGVSRHHAKIIHTDGEYYVIDTDSGNGTSLNGVVLKPNEKNILRHDDKIFIDDYQLRFSKIDELLNQSFNDLTDSDVLEVKLLRKVIGAIDKETLPSLEALNGAAAGKKVFLNDSMTELTIGREPGCELQIDEYVISRRHAMIKKGWGHITIEDLGSKNGIVVNKTKITEATMLHDGDKISLGNIVIIFRNPNEVNLEKMSEQITKKSKEASSSAKAAKKEAEEIPVLEESKEKVEENPLEIKEEMPQQLEASLSNLYPSPRKAKPKTSKLSPLEIGLVGLGITVFLFAALTILNLMFS